MAEAAKSSAIITHDKSVYMERHTVSDVLPERGWSLPQTQQGIGWPNQRPS
jgi:hypothetical protein